MNAKKKKRQISIEQYIEIYCKEKRIRGRFAVYISPEAHRSLKRIAQLFRIKHHLTTSSLADSIISQHIEAHRELLNKVQQEDDLEFLASFNKIRLSGNDNDDEESESYEEEE